MHLLMISQQWLIGIINIVQKAGEEAEELVIEAKDNNPELFKMRQICYSIT